MVETRIVDDQAVTRYARRYAEANMTAKVKITRMEEPAFDDTSGDLSALEAYVVYEGKARVYTISGPMTMNLGEEPQYFSSTYVSIPLDVVMPQVDDVIEVLAHGDWAVVGRKFRVMDVEGGGQYPAVRRMQVTGVQNSKQWRPNREPMLHPSIPEEWRI